MKIAKTINGVEHIIEGSPTDKRGFLQSWTDETGKRWSWPQLAWLQGIGFIEVIPPPMTPEELAQCATDRCNFLMTLVDSTANGKVGLLICEPDTTSYMARADSINRKSIKHLMAPATNPAPTEEEEAFIELCDTIQANAWAIREAARAICVELCQMTTEQLNGLSDQWVTSHILWP